MSHIDPCSAIASNNRSDWPALATTILARLARRGLGSSAFVDTDALVTGASAHDHAEEDPPSGTNESFDPELEEILGEFGVVPAVESSMPVAPPATARRRPRTELAQLVLRLVRQFVYIDALDTTLAGERRLVLLRCDHELLPAAERFLPDLLHPSVRTLGGLAPIVMSLQQALEASSSAPSVARRSLSEALRRGLDTDRAMIVLADASEPLPASILDLRPEILALAPFDRDVLRAHLTLRYPNMPLSDEEFDRHLPPATDLGGIRIAHLARACRAATPLEALTLLMRKHAPDQIGQGLATFPVAAPVHEEVEQVVRDLRDWKQGRIAWRDVTRGLLLSGPAGNGKTELPRLIAKAAGINVVAGSLAKWQAGGSKSSDTIQQMHAFFNAAASLAPAIAFIDEIDAIGDRGRPVDHNTAWTANIVGALLEQIDGFDAREGVVVMAATNFVDRVDQALLRPGRFDRHIKLDHPAPELLPKVLRWHLEDDLAKVDLVPFSSNLIGMSGAAVAELVRRARALARRQHRSLQLGDLETALSYQRPTLPDVLRRHIAVHEAGHAILAHYFGHMPELLAIHREGGIAQRSQQPGPLGLDEIENELAVILAGRAAELVALGRVTAGSGGEADSDLSNATRIAITAETSLGLGATLVWRGRPEVVQARLHEDPELFRHVEMLLRRAEARAVNILKAHRRTLDRLADALQARGILAGIELTSLLAEVDVKASARLNGPDVIGAGA